MLRRGARVAYPPAAVATLVYLSYAPEDIAHREALERHLGSLRRAGVLDLWHAGRVPAGEDTAAVAHREIDRAGLVLLLVSADYLSSEACQAEMEQALLRAQHGTRVVPILLRPCLSGIERLDRLAALPSDRRPVTTWPDRDSAWTEVARGIATALGQEGNDASAPPPARKRTDDANLRLLAELEDARVRRRRIVAKGVSTSDVDEEILALKRKLREGGQVRQGDLLGGRYSLLQRIGRGGFATVWEAEDRDRGERVAVKVLHANLADDADRRDRFFRGARVMSELSHEAVVRILSPREEDGGFCYFVMDLVAGGDLHTAVLAGRVSPERALSIVSRVGAALTEAHRRGFIHRDVKPANILLDEHGEPRLCDFDLVGGKDTTGGTRTGAMGSFVYAAPEMLSRPQDADARADVFGLGMTALFCLYGKKLPDIAFRDPKRVLDRLGRPELAAVIAKALEWEPEDRYGSAAAFCDALRDAEAREAGARTRVRVKTALRRPEQPASAPDAPARVPHPEGIALPEPGSSPPPSPWVPPPIPQAEPDLPPGTPPPAKRRTWGVATGASVLAAGAVAYMLGRGVVSQGEPAAPASAATASAAELPPSTDSDAESAGASSATPSTSSEPESPATAAPGTCPPSMVAIRPNGPVWIGSRDSQGKSNEHPRHQVLLEPYCMDRTEVTVAAYAACVTSKKCAPPQKPDEFCNGNHPDRQKHPVNCVTWDEASAHCTWLGGRLPTEEEWEFAARGPDEHVYPWGNALPSNQLCWNGAGSDLGLGERSSTCEVGNYRGGNSPFGLSDMAGNVWEWMANPHCPYYRKNCADPRHVLRGGGWGDRYASALRTANRGFIATADRNGSTGFRCARDM